MNNELDKIIDDIVNDVETKMKERKWYQIDFSTYRTMNSWKVILDKLLPKLDKVKFVDYEIRVRRNKDDDSLISLYFVFTRKDYIGLYLELSDRLKKLEEAINTKEDDVIASI